MRTNTVNDTEVSLQHMLWTLTFENIMGKYVLTSWDLCRGRGSVAWYPVHCTSINNTNSLISGDNKGVAAQFMEEWAVQSSNDGSATVRPDFVAAFGQSNVGDTSPNILGAFCQDTGGSSPLQASLPCLTHKSCMHAPL